MSLTRTPPCGRPSLVANNLPTPPLYVLLMLTGVLLRCRASNSARGSGWGGMGGGWRWGKREKGERVAEGTTCREARGGLLPLLLRLRHTSHTHTHTPSSGGCPRMRIDAQRDVPAEGRVRRHRGLQVQCMRTAACLPGCRVEALLIPQRADIVALRVQRGMCGLVFACFKTLHRTFQTDFFPFLAKHGELRELCVSGYHNRGGEDASGGVIHGGGPTHTHI